MTLIVARCDDCPYMTDTPATVAEAKAAARAHANETMHTVGVESYHATVGPSMEATKAYARKASQSTGQATGKVA